MFFTLKIMNNPQIEFKGLWHQMPLNKKEVSLFFNQVCSLQKLDNIAFELLVCNDKKSRYLNNTYLQCNSPTNILSFNQYHEEEVLTFLGSLAFSIDTFNREAFLYQQNKSSYAKHLLLHGFAHLLGFEHGIKMDIFCLQAKHLIN